MDSGPIAVIVVMVVAYVFIFVWLGSWIFDRAKRFSLREAFIAMTVIAILLGVILAVMPRFQ